MPISHKSLTSLHLKRIVSLCELEIDFIDWKKIKSMLY
jgi:hypothetical protein